MNGHLDTGIASDNTPEDLARIFRMAAELRAQGYAISLNSDVRETTLMTDAPQWTVDALIGLYNRT